MQSWGRSDLVGELVKTCSICGASNADSLSVCGNCGSPFGGIKAGAAQGTTGDVAGKVLRCPVCGTVATLGGQYCLRCGAIVAEPIRFDDPRLVNAADDLKRAIESRRLTDRIIEPMWAVVPLFLTIIGTIIGIVAMVSSIENISVDTNPTPTDVFSSMRGSFLIIAGFSGASTLILSAITYLLVKRRNDHFSREGEVRAALARLVQSAAWSGDRHKYVTSELMSMDVNSASSNRREPLLWAFAIALGGVGLVGLLSLTFATNESSLLGAMLLAIGLSALTGISSFVLMLYMFHWLGKDLRDHETSWNNFSYSAVNAMSKLGFHFPRGRSLGWNQVPERSFVLYFVLMIFFSPFVYYWWYTLIKDPNDHMRAQWVVEDEMLAAIGGRRYSAAPPVTTPLR